MVGTRGEWRCTLREVGENTLEEATMDDGDGHVRISVIEDSIEGWIRSVCIVCSEYRPNRTPVTNGDRQRWPVNEMQWLPVGG